MQGAARMANQSATFSLSGYDAELLVAMHAAFDGRIPTPSEAEAFLGAIVGNGLDQSGENQDVLASF